MFNKILILLIICYCIQSQYTTDSLDNKIISFKLRHNSKWVTHKDFVYSQFTDILEDQGQPRFLFEKAYENRFYIKNLGTNKYCTTCSKRICCQSDTAAETITFKLEYDSEEDGYKLFQQPGNGTLTQWYLDYFNDLIVGYISSVPSQPNKYIFDIHITGCASGRYDEFTESCKNSRSNSYQGTYSWICDDGTFISGNQCLTTSWHNKTYCLKARRNKQFCMNNDQNNVKCGSGSCGNDEKYKVIATEGYFHFKSVDPNNNNKFCRTNNNDSTVKCDSNNPTYQSRLIRYASGSHWAFKSVHKNKFWHTQSGSQNHKIVADKATADSKNQRYSLH